MAEPEFTTEDGICYIGRIMRSSLNEFGYYRRMHLCMDGEVKAHWPHRLVALAFIGPQPSSAHVINHRNGIKTFNRPDNLEWVTVARNNRHAIETGLMPPNVGTPMERRPFGRRNGKYTKPEKTPRGSRHGNAKLTETQVLEIRAKYATGNYSLNDIAVEYHVDKTLVSLIKRRHIWTHI